MEAKLLREFITLRGFSTKAFIEEIGISSSAYYKKLNGSSMFKAKEIRKIKEVLHLNGEELTNIFFNQNVSQKIHFD